MKSHYSVLSDQERSEGRDCAIHWYISDDLHYGWPLVSAQEILVELKNC